MTELPPRMDSNLTFGEQMEVLSKAMRAATEAYANLVGPFMETMKQSVALLREAGILDEQGNFHLAPPPFEVEEAKQHGELKTGTAGYTLFLKGDDDEQQ